MSNIKAVIQRDEAIIQAKELELMELKKALAVKKERLVHLQSLLQEVESFTKELVDEGSLSPEEAQSELDSLSISTPPVEETEETIVVTPGSLEETIYNETRELLSETDDPAEVRLIKQKAQLKFMTLLAEKMFTKKGKSNESTTITKETQETPSVPQSPSRDESLNVEEGCRTPGPISLPIGFNSGGSDDERTETDVLVR